MWVGLRARGAVTPNRWLWRGNSAQAAPGGRSNPRRVGRDPGPIERVERAADLLRQIRRQRRGRRRVHGYPARPRSRGDAPVEPPP
jgi:hypothetical protein